MKFYGRTQPLAKLLLSLPVAVAFCAFFSFSPISAVDGAEALPVKRVLIISTGSRLAPGFAIVDRQLLQALEKIPSARIETYAENLDLIRFPARRFQRIFTDYLTAKYAEHFPDLIILVYVGNLGLSGKLLSQLFPRTPIIVAGFTEEELRPDQFGPRVSGLAQRIDPRATLDLILRLQPEVRRVIVIGGTAEVDRHVIQRVRDAARPVKGRIEVTFWDNLSMAELRQAVTRMPRDTAILFTRMFRDAKGQAFISSQVSQWIGQWANVPVYVMTDSALGTGAVGGALASIEAFGKRAGELAQRILTGTAPTSLPLEIRTDSVPTFDWRTLNRWGILESRLPTGSVVLFKPPSMWEHYRGYIIVALVIIMIQAAMIIDLLLHRARRRRAEAELRQSHQFMELATKASKMGLWMRDLEKDEVWANAHLRSLFGFGPTDVIRFADVLARIHPYDRDRLALDAEKTGLPFEGEFRAILPDGSERWVEARGETFNKEARGRAARRVGAVIDITDRKRNEESLRESEARFRTMADTAPVMSWMSGEDKLCIFLSKGWLDFTGRTLDQELGSGWTEGVHPDDLARCLKTYTNAFNARREFTMEYHLRRHDGEYRWLLCQGVPRVGPDAAFRGYIGTAIDITERKRSAEALEKERSFLRQLLDIDPNFIFAKDREGRFTLANKAVADAYGTTVENLIGKTDADFNSNRDEIEFFQRLDLEVIDTLQERFIPEERLTDVHGKVRWVQTVKRPIRALDGSGTQVLGASTDITWRKEAEIQLQEQRSELAHVARVSIMGELAASLAHELNQPLTAILSNAQAALRFMSGKPAALEEVREILQDIVKDNSRAGEVIRRMRALVKKEKLEFASLDLASLMRDVVMLVHTDAIVQNVRISLELDGNLPPVRGDRVQIQQVVLNILLNAFDAMKACPASDRQVTVRTLAQGAHLIEVAVSDCGSGLSSDKLDKIFQPFYTTKGDGLGMGLSICRSIIEAHGGRLWAENNRDVGATFFFTVPVEKAAADPATWNEATAARSMA